MRAVRQHSGGIVAALLAAGIGVWFFGRDYLAENIQGIGAELAAALLVLAGAALAGLAVFLYQWVVAPSRLWRQGQDRIAELERLLTPSAVLRFDPADCVRNVPLGKVTEAESGKRWLDRTATVRQVLVCCECRSGAGLEGVAIDVVGVRRDGVGIAAFYQPVTLMRDLSVRPGVLRYVPVLEHTDWTDRPYLAGRSLPFEYHLLFDEAGVYEIELVSHVRDLPSCKAVLCVKLAVTPVPAAGRNVQRYEILCAYAPPRAGQA